MNRRLEKFTKILRKNNLDGFIVTNPTNIFYLVGFKGISPSERESILVFTRSDLDQGRTFTAFLITAQLYQNEAKSIIHSSTVSSLRQLTDRTITLKIVHERHQIFEEAQKLLSQTHPRGEKSLHPGGVSLGFEENDLKFSEHREFSLGSDPRRPNSSSLKGPTLKPHATLIEQMRIIKTADEVEKIEKAQIISQEAFRQLIKTIKVGQTEEEIADQLKSIIKSLGGHGLAFESIIASGPNSGKPHHKTGKRPLAKNDILLLDFGTKYQDYCADLSRTIFIGKTKDQQKKIYEHVQKAQKKALAKITRPMKSSAVYHTANNYFKKHKLQKYFFHGLGHGIGLDVHEKPYLRPLALQAGFEDEELKENMVFSIEPGLYFPWGGVRIEDLVVIKNDRTHVLGKLQEETIEI